MKEKTSTDMDDSTVPPHVLQLFRRVAEAPTLSSAELCEDELHVVVWPKFEEFFVLHEALKKDAYI